jgi:hypothetical protein
MCLERSANEEYRGLNLEDYEVVKTEQPLDCGKCAFRSPPADCFVWCPLDFEHIYKRKVEVELHE